MRKLSSNAKRFSRDDLLRFGRYLQGMNGKVETVFDSWFEGWGCSEGKRERTLWKRSTAANKAKLKRGKRGK